MDGIDPTLDGWVVCGPSTLCPYRKHTENPLSYCLVLGIVIVMMAHGAVKAKMPRRTQDLCGRKAHGCKRYVQRAYAMDFDADRAATSCRIAKSNIQYETFAERILRLSVDERKRELDPLQSSRTFP
jgi:hypothetical protein